jgi:bifunctional DNase/RNase
MKVFGLALDEDSQVPVLILKDNDEQKVLPIWIGAMEAMAISLALNEVKLPRPMTHDLLLSSITGLGAEVLAIEVTTLKDGTYYAEIELKLDKETRRVDSRPSDAIALALRAEAPIRVHEQVLEQASMDEKTGARPVIKTKDAEKWTELLENLSPDDIKYKM